MVYSFAHFITWLFFSTIYRLKAVGLEHIPNHGAVIVCCNHISYLDPPLLGTPLKRKIHYMAKAELFRFPGLAWLLGQLGAFPVKRGGVSKDAIKRSLELLKSGKVIGVFPEGTRNRSDEPGKKGAASLALKSGATVIPAAIIGRYAIFRTIRIVYGQPVDLSEFVDSASASEALEQATEKIMSEIRKLIADNELK
jgi:1-acyl-sn-glycerol-3-phosphate acyltransferase